MAVQVVSKNPPAELYKEVACKQCGWTYRYLAGDVKMAIHHDYGGGSAAWYYIPCLNEACFNDSSSQTKRSVIEVKRP